MLVITRRQGEFIRVKLSNGEQLTIHVTQMKGQQVRIGINASTDVKVHRGELLLEDSLKALKLEVGANCSDENFIEIWANMPIPALGRKTARELTLDPSRIDEVINEIRKNFS